MTRTLLCPSAPPNISGSVVFGVIGEKQDERVQYLDHTVPVTEELLASCRPVMPTEVLRIAAPCQQQSCVHFDGVDCQLVERLVNILPLFSSEVPRCAVRPNCLWFAQAGQAACKRCPQVITNYHQAPEVFTQIALPKGST